MLKAARGDTALKLAIREHPQVVLLETILPGMSGLDICRELRLKGVEIPIVLLANRSEETDIVVGLEIGADDFITKPFHLRELIARVRVQLRRAPAESRLGLARFRFGEVDLDFAKLRAFRSGKPLKLTSKEFEILRLFVRHRGEVLTRQRLLRDVWGYETAPATRTVDTHILALRRKLERRAAEPEYFLSVYGEGYRFVG